MSDVRPFIVTVQVNAPSETEAANIMNVARRAGFVDEVVFVLDPEQCGICGGAGVFEEEYCPNGCPLKETE